MIISNTMNMKFNLKLMLIGVVMAFMAVTPLAGQNLKMNGFAGNDESVLYPPLCMAISVNMFFLKSKLRWNWCWRFQKKNVGARETL